MSKNDGKATERLFDELYANRSGLVWYSFVDTYRARSFVNSQPSDRLLIYRGQAWLVEIKSSLDPVRFPLKNVSKKQIGTGRKWNKAGAKEMFIIHRILTNEFFFVPFDTMNKWFIERRSAVKWPELAKFKREYDYEFFGNW